jgi:hypothetical protein
LSDISFVPAWCHAVARMKHLWLKSFAMVLFIQLSVLFLFSRRDSTSGITKRTQARRKIILPAKIRGCQFLILETINKRAQTIKRSHPYN